MTTEADNTPTRANPAGATTGTRGFRLPERVPPLAGAAMGAAADADALVLQLAEVALQAGAACDAFDGTPESEDDLATGMRVGAAFTNALRALAAAEAATPAGVAAKGQALCVALRDVASREAAGVAEAEELLALSLAEDAARLAPATTPALLSSARHAAAPVVDAVADPLVTLARDAIAADEAFNAVAGQSPDAPASEAERALSQRALLLAARVAETPATTAAGLGAKAEAAWHFREVDDFGLGASLAQDVVRMAPGVRA